jgi:ABC-type Mn2+/Zn2+ transport system permease subunit
MHILQPYWPLLLSTLVSIPIGVLWYSPFLFLKQWAKMSHVSDAQLKKGPPPYAYIVSLTTAFLYAFLLRNMFIVLHPRVAWHALWIGFLFWLVFTFFPQWLTSCFDRRPLKLVAINTGSQLCNILVISFIIGRFG